MEKKNLTVLVGANDTIAGNDEAISAGITDEVALYSVGDMQTVPSGTMTTAIGGSRGVFFGVTMADGNFYRSDYIMPANITQITEQGDIDAVGQASTIASFENIDCETEYCVKVKYDSPEIAKNYGYQAMVKTYSYVTRCCGSACGCPDGAAWDVAMGIAEQLNNDPESAMNLTATTAKTILSATVNTSAFAWDTASELTNEHNLVKGSKILTIGTAATYEASAATLVAGDMIRWDFDDETAVGTLTGTSDVFRVEAVSGLNITLDRPWPHANLTVTAADNTGSQVIEKASAEALADSSWTLYVNFADGHAYNVAAGSHTGIIDNSGAGSLKWTRPYVVSAKIGLECNLDCNAVVTYGTAATQPEGYGYSIIQKELWANKGAGKKYGPYSGTTLYSRPVADVDYFAVAATPYTQYIIDYVETQPSAATDSNMPRPKRLIIAVPTASTTVTAELNAIGDAFNTLFNVPFHSLAV